MPTPEIVLLAHNIRSLWNVGTFFRNADCFGVSKIIFSGYTGVPPRREISKTALGADEWIPWEQAPDAIEVMKKYKSNGYQIVALELTDTAININEYKSADKILLILGHEVTGVPEEHLALADAHIYIPMIGKKESLNVSTACGIALQQLRYSSR